MNLVKSLLPPVAAGVLRRISGGLRRGTIRFTGDFASWEEAEQVSSGYAAPIILARTRAASLKVKNREAAYERDSVLFDTVDHPYPLLAGLLRAATENDGRLSVLDFGGSLGSTYFQCRDFLTALKELRWSIVEQPAYVACGRSDFETDQLRFYESIDECLGKETPTVVLLCCVVQYLPDPHAFAAGIVERGLKNIIVDRTAFIRRERDRLTIQHVPESIYPAVYPSWFLSEDRFLAKFSDAYELLSAFPGPDRYELGGEETYFKGFIFRRKNGR